MKKNFFLLTLLFCSVIAKSQQNNEAIARELITKNKQEIGLGDDDLKNVIIKTSYFDRFAKAQMVYLQQSYLSLPVYNEIQVLAFKDGKTVSNVGGRIRKIAWLAGNSADPMFIAEAAVMTALKEKNLSPKGQLDGKIIDGKIDFGKLGVCSETITAELMWLPLNQKREVHLAWQIRVVPDKSDEYLMIRVDAMTNKVVDITNYTVTCNWNKNESNCNSNNTSSENNIPDENAPQPLSPNVINNAAYIVVPYPAESPKHTGGTPDTVYNPWNLSPGNATSLGWHNDGSADYSGSRGNNVYSQEDRDGSNTTFGGTAFSTTATPDLSFLITPDFTQTPTTNNNQQFSLSNLFYWNNLIHDASYLHGFDEVAGNFQNSNLGRGGLGNDYVIADCQDNGGTNNANFSTPDDGNKPRMQMYLWSGNPQRDGSLDNAVVTHEFGHGISNRLTGGPLASGCLNNGENMGEGWSDYIGLMFTQNWVASNLNTGYSTPRSVGTFAAGQNPTGQGIRSQRYCTNMSVNTKVYATTIPAESHDRGEIWCAVLWDMTWNLINKTGLISPTLFDTSQNSLGGNIIAYKLVIEGMKLQPCNPGFISGRDAIIKADSILYGGAYHCVILESFRRRGMGALASQGSTDAVTDQIADYTGGVDIILTQGGITSVAEGQNINYVISVYSSCQDISNYIIKDTLPSNVTYVSGGTYDAANRIVSFSINQAAGIVSNYQFTVKVNTGTYFPTTTLINETANGAIPAGWITTATPAANVWAPTTAAYHSAPGSFYVENLTVAGDQKLVTTVVSLPANTNPRLSFWHKFNTEDGWDGGVVEISANGGSTWNDLESYFSDNGYNSSLGAATTCVLQTRNAFTGTIDEFKKSTIDLGLLAGLNNVRFRFWFASDDNTTAPTSPAGWYVDDILLEVAPIVKMRAAIFSPTNVRVSYSDTVTYITQVPTCINALFNSQPANISVCSGSIATLSVNAQGTDNIYQWQVSTDGGLNYSDIAGADSTTYTIANVTSGLNNYRYRIIATNNCPSSSTSNAAILQVLNPAAISSQPNNQTVCSGNNAGFTVNATGGVNGYQWQVSTNGGTSFSDISGANSNSLTISSVNSTNDGYKYRVNINSCNSEVSNTVLLTVLTSPEITTAPQSVAICNGQNHTFSVAANASDIAYQWQISTDGGNNYSDITGAIASTYSIASVTTALNNYKYRVIITGTCPTVAISNAALLTVGGTLNIADQPSNILVCAGSDASISINASGVVGYQWQVSTNGGSTFTNIAGAINATLAINNVTTVQQGNQYRVVLTNCAADVNSGVATLTVSDPANISIQPINTAACIGTNASISVTASGSSITYQWQVSTDGGNTYSIISGATSSTLSVNNVSFSVDNNRYKVIITPISPCIPITSDEVTLTIYSLPLVYASVSPSDSVCAGSQITLTGSGASSYSWSPSVNDNVSFIPPVSGNYTVTGTDANGCSATSSISIIVNPLPIVTIAATPTTRILQGDSVTLTATANPTSVSYNWYRNNALIAGQTTSTIKVGLTGNYKATVRDEQPCDNTSNTVAILDSARTNVFIYPNPNNGQFTIRLPNYVNNATYSILIYDSKGARVFVGTAKFTNQEAHMYLPNLSHGIYMIRLQDRLGREIRTGKLDILEWH